MVVCAQSYKTASKTWSRITEEHDDELSTFCQRFKFPGRSQKDQSVITFSGALTLMNLLPGESAKKWRSKTTEILRRYFAGDPSLLKDIEANASSDAPINQAARASLQSEAQQGAQMPELNDDIEERLVKHRKIEECNSKLSVYNTTLEKHITLKKKLCDVQEREYEMEIHFESNKLKIEQEKLNIERSKLDVEERKIKLDSEKLVVLRNELDYKRALKAFEAEPTPSAPSPPIPSAIPDAPETTTVLKLYEANKGSFHLLRSDQRKSFLQKAGSLAGLLYGKEHGKFPNKETEGAYEVNSYPIEAQPILSEALRKTYREMTAGNSQTTIGDAFLRSANSVV